MDLFSCLSPFVFCSFASGSSGNCYYVGRQEEGILVDVGISAKQVKMKLLQQDLTLNSIKAILVTHVRTAPEESSTPLHTRSY